MNKLRIPAVSRRKFLATSTAAIAGAAMPMIVTSKSEAAKTKEITLKATIGSSKLDTTFPQSATLWRYNGSNPGPELRVKQGETIRITAENDLDEQTTVHWHGVRTPNNMDGVPHLTQKPISPGESFTYEFTALDAGTFWYHPHQRSFEQVGRGLYGPLIVEEHDPVKVDRDVTWMLDDWRVTKSGEIRNDFGNSHDMSHSGRMGNLVTINGKKMQVFPARKGERIRLRLINAANARIFALDFQNHNPKIIALDGQPVTPHSPDSGLVIVGPAMRVDLILDMTEDVNSSHAIVDRFYQGLEYQLTNLKYTSDKMRNKTPDDPIQLPKNSLPEPNLINAECHEVLFNGGMMGGMIMRQMGLEKGPSMSMMGRMHSKKIWLINGVAAEGHIMEPMLTLDLNRSHIVKMTNATAWYHPIHLHGHSFKVLSRNGQLTPYQEWQDTVLMAPRERIEIAFVADNPGDWMFHCHILEHAASGMMGVIRVA